MTPVNNGPVDMMSLQQLRGMGRVQRIHFTGIGGAGMSGIALVLHNLGFLVSGSDQQAGAVTEWLQTQGIAVSLGHDAAYITGAQVLVRSTAIGNDNIEVQAAQAQQVPVIRRAEMLAELMRFRYGIAVAGTHGKTTTTSLIAALLHHGGLDPTYIIGGRIKSDQGNSKVGASDFLVVEADESDASFLCLQPMMAVVTNIDADHLDTYQQSFSKLQQAYLDFLHHLPFYGLAVVCVDDPVIRQRLPDISRPLVRYGLSDDADVQARSLRMQGMYSEFELYLPAEKKVWPIRLHLPGEHNVRNALAAVAIGQELGVPMAVMSEALAGFSGIARRMDRRGCYALSGGRRVLHMDDYGHHPSEVAATLGAVRASWPEQRLLVLFQPHRYSRTRDLFDDFVQALTAADVLILSEVYAAGEPPIDGADSRALCRALRARGKLEPVLASGPEQWPVLVDRLAQDGDVLLTLGAGDIGRFDLAQLPECHHLQA